MAVDLAQRAAGSWRDWLRLLGIPRALLVAVRRARPVRAGRNAPPPAFRGLPVLVAGEDGRPLCTSCGACERVCPTHCIRVLAGDEPGAPPQEFTLDAARCLFCGACEEACPDAALVMSSHVELAATGRAGLRYSLDALLVPAALVQRRTAFLAEDAARRRGDEADLS